MKISVLMENTALDDKLCSRHGLSLLIESGDKCILMDTGPDECFADNAAAMGADLRSVQYCVLSHGHHDHGGGLHRFLAENTASNIYLRSGAFKSHTNEGRDIGIDPALADSGRIIYTEDGAEIFPGAVLFGDAPERFEPSPINSLLFEDGEMDAFSHEQSLVLEEEGRYFLFSGCAHQGIVNIIEKAVSIIGRAPDVVFSGFHLNVGPVVAPDDYSAKLAEKLLSYGSEYYTCHCTGLHPFGVMKDIMGDKLHYAPTGMVTEL